jgi:peptidoglycan/xylan/chitin deacetylase (PgdA/CDA1 family)
MNAIATAARGKGARNTLRRAREIRARYGIGPERMEGRVKSMFDIVAPYGCRATLPITAVVAARHPKVIAEYAARGMEFPVHGYWHVDHAGLPEHVQLAQLARAREAFETAGIPFGGFRAPYLRWNEATLRAVAANGYLYDASQAMYVDLEGGGTDAYQRVLEFCGALPARDHPVVPWTESGLVRIPYVLPDDESLLDRLDILAPDEITARWMRVFATLHDRGELFTLAVHPERVEPCAEGIAAVLDAARRAPMPVWIALHEEIARWWHDRGRASVDVTDHGDGRFGIAVHGPVGITILARGLGVDGAEPWADGFDLVHGTRFEVRADARPFIGVHPSSPSSLSTFLREQGFIVETSEDDRAHTCFLRRSRFTRLDQRALLDELDRGSFPLVRLGRWPQGAHSALSITGDIDALTLGDYVYRIIGR